MSTTKVGRLWNDKGKCLTKKDIWLNQLKYTIRNIEDYEDNNIDKKTSDTILKDINGNLEEMCRPRVEFLRISGLIKIKNDTQKDILKTRENILKLNLQIPLSKNKEVLEELQEQLHYEKAKLGDEYDEDYSEDTLQSDLDTFNYLISIVEYVSEQENINSEDIIITIETSLKNSKNII